MSNNLELLIELRRIADSQERIAASSERLLAAIELIGTTRLREFGDSDDEPSDDEGAASPETPV